MQILTNLFGEKSSVFNIHWKCLNLMKKKDEDFFSRASVIGNVKNYNLISYH